MISAITHSGYTLSIRNFGRPPCQLGQADVDDLTGRIEALDEEQLRGALRLLAVSCSGYAPTMDAELLGRAIAYGETYHEMQAKIRAKIDARVQARKAAWLAEAAVAAELPPCSRGTCTSYCGMCGKNADT